MCILTCCWLLMTRSTAVFATNWANTVKNTMNFTTTMVWEVSVNVLLLLWISCEHPNFFQPTESERPSKDEFGVFGYFELNFKFNSEETLNYPEITHCSCSVLTVAAGLQWSTMGNMSMLTSALFPPHQDRSSDKFLPLCVCSLILSVCITTTQT